MTSSTPIPSPEGAGLPVSGVPLFERPFTLSWHERQEWTHTITPPWWKFWAKPKTLHCSQWVRQSRQISKDLADYLLSGDRRAEELVVSMCGAARVTNYSFLQLEDNRTISPYIATSSSDD